MNGDSKWMWMAFAAMVVLLVLRPGGLMCASCLRLSSQWPGFVTGTAMLAGLLGALAWLETAPLRQIAQHAVVAAAVFGALALAL